MSAPRHSLPGEEEALKELWRVVFGDEDSYIDAFFRLIYRPGMASVVEEDGKIVASAYAVPFGDVKYIYAVGTLPEYRARGYGRAVTLAAAAGEPAYICPADATLRCWYALTMNAQTVSYRPSMRLPHFLHKIGAEEYNARREEWLEGVHHAKYTPEILELFAVSGKFYCGDNGDIYAVEGRTVREALPAPIGDEPFLMGLNGAKPIYWGLALE